MYIHHFMNKIKLFTALVITSALLVGCGGAILHLAMVGGFLVGREDQFWRGQTVASVSAMVFNFVLNNLLTYQDLATRTLHPS